MLRPLALGLLFAGCQPAATDAPVDTDTDTDLGESCAYERPERAAPGELKAGVSRRRVPAPVGIGTAGFGPFGAPSSPSPFSSVYPGTKRIHGHPEVKVVVLSRGVGHEAVMVRLDAVGVFAQLRGEIVREASERVGHDLEAAILLGATHTHSGPSGVLNTGSSDSSPYDFIADKFFAEFYDRFVDAVAGAIADAYLDLAPARLGTAIGTCDDGHADRRCEDGEDYQNPLLPLLAVEREGQIDAVVMSYAIHGTLFNLDELYLSQDVSGAIEEAVEDRFDHPVEAIMFNAWAGDMSPGPASAAPVRTWGINDGGYEQARKVGWVVAEAVDDAIAALTWTTEPRLDLEIHHIPINRDVLGYDESTFPYDYGAVYCEGGSECEPPRVRDEELDEKCLIRFPEAFPAPTQTDVTVGRIADLAITTFPGEAGTRLAERIMDRMKAAMPDARDVMFFGYTQDYLGYSILEEDWWFGGYEASGALWGPRQGEYLSSEVSRLFESFAADTCPGVEPPSLTPFPYSVTSPYQVAPATQAGTVLADVPESVEAGSGVVTLSVRGRDPWLGAPLAWIETEAGVAIERPNGVRVESDDYNFDVALEVTPPWSDDTAEERTFAWTFRLPVRQPVEGGLDLAPGTYRMVVDIPDGDGGSGLRVSSRVFTVTAEAE